MGKRRSSRAVALDDRARVWRASNTRRLADDDRRLGHDAGGFCAEPHRCLTYPEQRRGARSLGRGVAHAGAVGVVVAA